MIKLALRTFAATLIVGTIAAAFGSTVHAQEAAAPAAAASTTTAGSSEAAPGEKKFTLVSEQIGDTKFWLPSTIVVDPGDKVTLTLKNEVPGAAVATHGFELPAFHISEVVTRGEKPKVVHFTADKPGVYPYYCQLHGAHVGGQLVVEAK